MNLRTVKVRKQPPRHSQGYRHEDKRRASRNDPIAEVSRKSKLALECQLLTATHNQWHADNNVRAFSLQANLAMNRGNMNDYRMCLRAGSYWQRQADQATAQIERLKQLIASETPASATDTEVSTQSTERF